LTAAQAASAAADTGAACWMPRAAAIHDILLNFVTSRRYVDACACIFNDFRPIYQGTDEEVGLLPLHEMLRDLLKPSPENSRYI